MAGAAMTSRIVMVVELDDEYEHHAVPIARSFVGAGPDLSHRSMMFGVPVKVVYVEVNGDVVAGSTPGAVPHVADRPRGVQGEAAPGAAGPECGSAEASS